MKTLKADNFEPPTFNELKDFTLESYQKLLQYLKQVYKIVPFCGIPGKDVPYLILRHDIDVSLPAALKMAEIERDLGVKSTYFVLFSSKFYNVFEGHNVDFLRQISKLGHEIGLHYYVSQYRSYGGNAKKTLMMQIQLLEHLLGRKVYAISRHGSWDRDPFATIKKYINANHPSLRGDLFIHDSCRAWTPLQGLFRLLNDPPRRVQLLTHPENWQEDKIDRRTLLERFIQNLEKEISALKRNKEKKWLTDSLVLKYDALVKKGDFMQFHNNRCGSDSKIRMKLRREFNYYNKQFRWYGINTSLGWWARKIIAKIRNIVQYRRN
jgi:peptidoglycan/xylan/chitin deacetylase (PgdA/CDA1 family)